MTILNIRDITDPTSIIEAFQQALDMVVSKEGINKILTDRYDTHHYQHIYWRDQPAIGCVTMLTSGPRETITVFITIYRRHEPDILALLDSFAERAYAWFEDTNLLMRFNRDKQNNEHKIMITLPSQWFLGAPSLQMHLD